MLSETLFTGAEQYLCEIREKSLSGPIDFASFSNKFCLLNHMTASCLYYMAELHLKITYTLLKFNTKK